MPQGRLRLPFGPQLSPILDSTIGILCGSGCIFKQFTDLCLKTPKMAPRGPKSAHRGSKRAPRGAQGGAGAAKTGPRSAQDSPKTAPSCPKAVSKSLPNRVFLFGSQRGPQDPSPGPPLGRPGPPQDASRDPHEGPKSFMLALVFAQVNILGFSGQGQMVEGSGGL